MSGGKSSSSNSTSSSSTTTDAKQTADGEAIVARSEGGDVIINKTLDEAVDIAEMSLDSVNMAVSANGDTYNEALRFAEGVVEANYDLSRSSLDEVSQANYRALGVIAKGFDDALQESREDTTQLLSQAITYGIPAAIVYLIWSRSA